MTHLIDTPQVRSVIKTLKAGDPLLDSLREVSEHGRLYISVITHGEVISLISRIEAPAVRTQADQNYKTLIASIGSQNILPIDEAVSMVWAKNCALCTPDQFPEATSEALLVASTAEYYRYKLICSNQSWHAALPDVAFQYV